MLVSELLRSSQPLLMEKLGPAVRALNVGSMLNILKQSSYSTKRSGTNVTAAYNRFGGSHRIGATSHVVDIGQLKEPMIGSLRKAFKQYPNARAFALYVDNQAVAFGIFDEHALGGSSREGIFTYNLKPLEKEIDRKHEADREAQTTDWSRNQVRKIKTSNYSEDEEYQELIKKSKDEILKTLLHKLKKEHEEDRGWGEKTSHVLAIIRRLKKEGGRSWPELDSIAKSVHDKKPAQREIKPGQAFSTGHLKSFLEQLKELAGHRKVTAKLVMQDVAGGERARTRGRRMNSDEVYAGLEALQKRLKIYKNSKKPTVKTIQEFIQATFDEKAKTLQFAGHTYSTAKEASYGSSTTAAQVLAGHSFHVHYKSVDPDAYGTWIDVHYFYDKHNGTLKPFKAEWPDENNKKRVTILDPESHLRSEMPNAGKQIPKDVVIGNISKKAQAVSKHYHPEVKRLIHSARKAGHDYPEFKDIESKLDPSAKIDEE